MKIDIDRGKLRLVQIGIAVLLIASFIFYVWAGNVTPASGATAISADTAATGGTGAWTSLSGPTYGETINGDIGNGTVVLTVPTGFEFNTASPITVILTTGATNANTNMNNVALGANVAGVTGANFSQTATTITFTVFSKSQGNVLNTIQWRGIQVRPLNGTPLASGNIVPSGTSMIAAVANSTNFGTLTEVPGAMTKLLTVLPGQTFTAGTGITGTSTSQTAGTAFNLTQLIATDQFNNPVTTYSGTKTISYAGPSSGCSVSPSYTTSVSFTNGKSTTTLATTLTKAETIGITASDGAISGPVSSSLLVNPAAMSRLVVTLPGQSFSACSGNSGTASSQSAGVTFNIPFITATDAYFNTISGYSGTKTLAYSGPSGTATYTTSVNFSGGQSTTTLATNIATAQTTTISVTDGSVSGPASSSFIVNSTVSSFNVFETSTAAGTTTGGVIKTKISGTSFDLAIVALTSASPATVSTGFTGTVKVELVNNSGGGSCATLPTIQTLATNQIFAAADSGRHTIAPAITEVNAWKDVKVRISHPVTSPTIISCSADNFAIRPSSLTITVTDLNATAAGTTRPLNNTTIATAVTPGGVVHNAGRPFTVTATVAAGLLTGNYAESPVKTVSQCATAGGVCPASVGTLTLSAWTASSGSVTASTASYNDVGAFSLKLEDQTFAAVDAADSTTAERYFSSTVTVGRFVPDHFTLGAGAIVPRTDIAACSAASFTYMKEPFQLSFGLVAQDAANATTANYAGALATLDASDPSLLNLAAVDTASATNLTASISAITLANPGKVTTATAHGFATGGKIYISGVNGMTGVNNALYTVTVVDSTNFTIGVDSTGFGAYTSGGTASRLSVTSVAGSWLIGASTVVSTLQLQRSVQPDGPFNTLTVGAAPRDRDGIQVAPSALNMDADKDGSVERVSAAVTQLRFGRIALNNAYGSELLNLPVPVQTQYWNGSNFLTNVQDNCTSVSSPGNFVFSNYQGGVNTGNMVSPGNIILGGAFIAGVGSLTLIKPTPQASSKGSVDVTLDLSAENKTYLQGNWSGPGYNQNPKSRATFGIYKGGPIIYRRENY